MAWYRAGTVTVTNGSAFVTGAGTDFVSNTSVGEAFLGADGRVYEIVQVVSATQIVLSIGYQGASAGGQGFAVLPTQSFARDLALGAAQLLNTFAAVRDGIGAGLFPDGSAAGPGIRFSADQDTGITRAGANILGLVAGGVIRATFDSAGASIVGNVGLSGAEFPTFSLTRQAVGNWNVGGTGIAGDNAFAIRLNSQDAFLSLDTGGNVGVGTKSPQARLVASKIGAEGMEFFPGNGSNINLTQHYNRVTGVYCVSTNYASTHVFSIAATEAMRIDGAGNLLAGVASGTTHSIYKSLSSGTVLNVGSSLTAARSLQVFAVDAEGASGASTAVSVGRTTSNGRSLNAGGTINASGADYAEYMLKAAGCGRIAKGDICGIDRDGRLTKTWADAVSFVVKSTDPSLVGGDTWNVDVGPKPDEPGSAPVQPVMPSLPGDDASEDERAAWDSAVANHPAHLAAYQHANAEWQAAADAHAEALTAWEAAHETARQCVDRIAFCGQVPVNVASDFAVGDYIIAAANGAGIQAKAIAEAAITFEQYRRRIGKVWAVRDGRAWVDVQHG